MCWLYTGGLCDHMRGKASVRTGDAAATAVPVPHVATGGENPGSGYAHEGIIDLVAERRRRPARHGSMEGGRGMRRLCRLLRRKAGAVAVVL